MQEKSRITYYKIIDEQVMAFLNKELTAFYTSELSTFLTLGVERVALSFLNSKKVPIQKLYCQQYYYTSYQEVDIFSNGTFAINNVLYLEKFNP